MSNVFYANLDKKYKCVERAEGSWVYDTDGKKYLDCAAGIAVTNIGQGIKEVAKRAHSSGRLPCIMAKI